MKGAFSDEPRKKGSHWLPFSANQSDPATHGDGFDLDLHVFRQTSDFHTGARREGGIVLGEERFVGGVNGSEIVEIFDEYGGLDDVADGEASGFNDRFHVVQRLTHLRGHVFRDAAGFRVDRDLARG